MKVFVWFLIHCLGLATVTTAQNACQTHRSSTKKTLIIRKKDKQQNISSASTTSIQYPTSSTTKEKDIVEATQTTLNNKATKTFLTLPTLAGGEFGLMNIQPYQKDMDLRNWKFVILEYSISPYGWATKVNVLKTNDERLKRVVLQKLKQSKWNPATNTKGTPVEYKMYQQIIIVKDKTYEEDYYKDY